MATLSGLALLITAVPVSAKQASTASSAAVPAQASAALLSGYIAEVSAAIRSRLYGDKLCELAGGQNTISEAILQSAQIRDLAPDVIN
jgi:membrane protein involved in colicin uptake